MARRIYGGLVDELATTDPETGIRTEYVRPTLGYSPPWRSQPGVLRGAAAPPPRVTALDLPMFRNPTPVALRPPPAGASAIRPPAPAPVGVPAAGTLAAQRATGFGASQVSAQRRALAEIARQQGLADKDKTVWERQQRLVELAKVEPERLRQLGRDEDRELRRQQMTTRAEAEQAKLENALNIATLNNNERANLARELADRQYDLAILRGDQAAALQAQAARNEAMKQVTTVIEFARDPNTQELLLDPFTNRPYETGRTTTTTPGDVQPAQMPQGPVPAQQPGTPAPTPQEAMTPEQQKRQALKAEYDRAVNLLNSTKDRMSPSDLKELKNKISELAAALEL